MLHAAWEMQVNDNIDGDHCILGRKKFPCTLSGTASVRHAVVPGRVLCVQGMHRRREHSDPHPLI